MIIRHFFHTYKKEFPIIRQFSNGEFEYLIQYDVPNLFKNLIFELSELTTLPNIYYMSRQGGDKPKDDTILEPFKKSFVSYINKYPNSDFGIPIVWLVVYSEKYESIDKIRNELDKNDIKYWENSIEYSSLSEIKDDYYYKSEEEAKMFPIFLHQTTQIGIDLLKSDTTNKLNSLKNKQKKLENHFKKNSLFYLNKISNDKNIKSKFWTNFQNNKWSHFLDNICGV